LIGGCSNLKFTLINSARRRAFDYDVTVEQLTWFAAKHSSSTATTHSQYRIPGIATGADLTRGSRTLFGGAFPCLKAGVSCLATALFAFDSLTTATGGGRGSGVRTRGIAGGGVVPLRSKKKIKHQTESKYFTKKIEDNYSKLSSALFKEGFCTTASEASGFQPFWPMDHLLKIYIYPVGHLPMVTPLEQLLYNKDYNFQKLFINDLWNSLWTTKNSRCTTGGTPGPR